MIATKKSIPHQILPSFPTKILENISVQIHVNNRPIRLTAAFNPRFTAHFLNDINKITNSDADYFILGDLNALHTSWHCLRNNSAGNSLYGHQLQNDYYIYTPNSFTRFGQRTTYVQPSVVDILLTNSALNLSPNLTHLGILPSDHVSFSFEIFGMFEERVYRIPLYNRANWNAIREWVDLELPSIDSKTLTHDNI